MKFYSMILASCIGLTTSLAFAHDFTAGNIKINHPWARASVTGQVVGGGFMTLSNQGQIDDALIAVIWADSKTVELHTHTLNNGVMQMRQLPKINLAAGKVVHLAPGGLHVMFMELSKPLVAGEKRDATLVFEKAGKVQVQFKVEPLDYKPAQSSEPIKHAH